MLNIAVVGLEGAGRDFVMALCGLDAREVRVIGVVDPGAEAQLAGLREQGVRVMDLDEMVALGEAVDIVFDLAGDGELRRRLRRALFASDNRHTVIAPRSVARLVWLSLGGSALPLGEEQEGY